MNQEPLTPDASLQPIMQDVIGYLNFSSGTHDPKFLHNIDLLFRDLVSKQDPGSPATTVQTLCLWLTDTLQQLQSESKAFSDTTQAASILELFQHKFVPAYRKFHQELLWHLDAQELWRPFLIGKSLEMLIHQGAPWKESDRIITNAIKQINDFVGYRPVAVIESHPHIEPYPHEWVRPIPVYIEGAGTSSGPYEKLIEKTLEILRDTDPDLLREAWFDPNRLEELAIDPRAYDFEHPVNKRPNYHFGQWDPHSIDNQGYYRRFVLQGVIVNSLMVRVEELSANTTRDPDELIFEAAATLAGTMLMASGTCGDGPTCHNSDVTIGTLLPHIAEYRDHFYDHLLAKPSPAKHHAYLLSEAKQMHQAFGGARQHLNQELAHRRALQLQRVQLAQLFARMGYPEAALRQANTVRITSARMLCQIFCRLTAGHHAIDARRLGEVAEYLPEIEQLLYNGIECGAFADPWNIVGFGGNFSLFPALENTIRDYRIDHLIELVEQILDLCARAWTEAAAIDDEEKEKIFSQLLTRLGNWWDKYASSSISDLRRLVAKEVEVSTNLVAGALNAWHKAGAAAGDIRYWRMFVDQFDTPKSFQLVIEALLDKEDLVASMALMMQWVSQVEQTPLDEGDVSFHPLAKRWLRMVEQKEVSTNEPQWDLVEKFFIHLESSSESFWQVPRFEVETDFISSEELLEYEISDEEEEPDDSSWVEEEEYESDSYLAAENRYDDPLEEDLEEELDEEEEGDNLFKAAYENVTFNDSTDDGFESDTLGEGDGEIEYELEYNAVHIQRRLAFLLSLAKLWKQTAIVWAGPADPAIEERRELLETWRLQAAKNYTGLSQFLTHLHSYQIPEPLGTQQSMIEYDRRRMLKEVLGEAAITTSVAMADASRLLRAALLASDETADNKIASTGVRGLNDVLHSMLQGNPAGVQTHWSCFCESLLERELLYVPMSKGGNPRRIVRARAIQQLINDLLKWLPRLGLIRETCELLEVAQRMESFHPVGEGAITEYDAMFERGYQAIVQCASESSCHWEIPDAESLTSEEKQNRADQLLVDILQRLAETLLQRWLNHSQSLRLNSVERLSSEKTWLQFVSFVKRYGADFFNQSFLNLRSLRTILHQQTSNWLANFELDPDSEEIRLIQELGSDVTYEEANKMLTIAFETVVDNFREYRDYNTTTTQSDYGVLLYTLIDFLRLQASYNRVAWNLKPILCAHETLVRNNRLGAAEMWEEALVDRTNEIANQFIHRYQTLCEKYSMRLATVADRLSQKFTRPLLIDRVRALVEPAINAQNEYTRGTAFATLERQIETLVLSPGCSGLETPDWLVALDVEVTRIYNVKRHREQNVSFTRKVKQIHLGWEDFQDQLTDLSDDSEEAEKSDE